MATKRKRGNKKSRRRNRGTYIKRVLRRLADSEVQQRRREFEESKREVVLADREPAANRVVVVENEQLDPPAQKPNGWIRRTANLVVEATKKVAKGMRRRVEFRDRESEATTSASIIHTEINPDLAPVEFELDVSAGPDVDLL